MNMAVVLAGGAVTLAGAFVMLMDAKLLELPLWVLYLAYAAFLLGFTDLVLAGFVWSLRFLP